MLKTTHFVMGSSEIVLFPEQLTSSIALFPVVTQVRLDAPSLARFEVVTKVLGTFLTCS